MNIRTLALATLVSSGALALSQPAAAANVSTFDDLALAPDSYFFPKTSTTFTSGAATFNHSFNDWGGDCCHTDWVYSNLTDTTTEGYLNQHSAIAVGGAEGSANYAVANIGAPVASFAAPVSVLGAWFTNSTYAALSMQNGDGFAKQFGGASGSDADWFMLTITGLTASARAPAAWTSCLPITASPTAPTTTSSPIGAGGPERAGHGEQPAVRARVERQRGLRHEYAGLFRDGQPRGRRRAGTRTGGAAAGRSDAGRRRRPPSDGLKHGLSHVLRHARLRPRGGAGAKRRYP